MAEEGVDARLKALEMKVEVLDQSPLQKLALAPSSCCNSCNNAKENIAPEEQPQV